MDFVGGSLAGVFAGIFTNPFDVVKTRLQLQGELQAPGQHAVHYKNTIQAFFLIAKAEGLTSLQKGLVPALWFQVCLNGIRLGSVDILDKWGWTSTDKSVSGIKTGLFAAFAGCLGSYVGSPFYLVKVHLQSQAAGEIAVGYQHDHRGTCSTLVKIYKNEGLRGLWRGAISSLPRVAVGGGVQLGTFSKTKEFLERHEILTKEKSLWNSFVASMCCGVIVAVCMTPFDVIQTRMYNQGLDKNGKGLLYSGVVDCFVKTIRAEGLLGLFKGFGPCYLRIGPHSLLTLVFWDSFKQFRGSL